MKKALILLIALLMIFEGVAVYAESQPETLELVEAAQEETTEEAEAPEAEAEAPEAEEEAEGPEITYDYDELTVSTLTPFDGKFFTNMWGNVTSDLDVRLLIHGYNLVEWRSEDGVFAVDPSVVSGIVVTENQAGDRTYTLTIYNDLYYSDGTQITAWDYAFSMLLGMAPEVEEIGGAINPKEYLVGYDNYVTGATSYLAGVRVLSNTTLSFTVSNEYLPFFYELALLDCVPYPISVIAPGCRVADDGNGIYITNADANVTEPQFTAEALRETILNEETGYMAHPTVVSGPYRLVSYDGTTCAFEINEYFKGDLNGAKPTIPRLYYTATDSEAGLKAFSAGEIGVLNKCVSAGMLEQATQMIAGSDVFTFTNYTRLGMSFISFCCEQEPVNSLAVRQAIAMCMDKDAMVEDTVSNYGLRVDGYYGLGQWMYQLIDGTQAYPVEAPDETADQAAIDAYDAEIEAWQAVNLDEVRVYDLDLEEATHLLESDGWTLNRAGEPFDPEKDDVRCKDVDGTLKALELKLIAPEGSSLNANLQKNFTDYLNQVGIALNVEVVPMQQLLRYYYRQEERDCQMIMLASNFDIVFDPSVNFRPDGEEVNHYNTTAIDDQQLYELTVDMRQTSSDDVRGYCEKWVKFETRFQEVVPVISLYSNVYFDFYPRVLHDYNISSNTSWAQAIVGAYMSDVSDEEEAAYNGDEFVEVEGEGDDASGFVNLD